MPSLIRKRSVDPAVVYTCLESFVSAHGTHKAGDRVLGSDPAVSKLPDFWVRSDATDAEVGIARGALAQRFLAAAPPEVPDPRFRIGEEIPADRQFRVVRTLHNESMFLAAGQLVDSKMPAIAGLMKAHPSAFEPAQ